MAEPVSIVWFRNDLRVADHPALAAAAERGRVIAVFCWCPAQWRSHGMGTRRMAFIARTLRALGQSLAARSIPLHVLLLEHFADVPAALLGQLRAHGASALYFNDEYPLDEQRRDRAVAAACTRAGIRVERTTGCVLSPPGTIRSRRDTVLTVFSAFRRRWLELAQPGQWEPLPSPPAQLAGAPAAGLPAFPGIDESELAELWPGGEIEAGRRLTRFVSERLGDYDEARDFPAKPGTSTLSPYLAIGALSARQALAAALDANEQRVRGGRKGVERWIDELLWREFYQHLTAALPRLSRGKAFRAETEHLPWRHDAADLDAWQQGRTGYPLVDAGMRQLNATGWMHNRLRMVTAMFLSKHLLLDWRLGEAWFMQQLVDGDFAANNGGWQWSASTGCDAVPYFRIFNPVTQAKRFDPDGAFVRAHVPELREVPVPFIFEPWRAPTPAPDYPAPIVDHAAGRERALGAFQSLRSLDPALVR